MSDPQMQNGNAVSGFYDPLADEPKAPTAEKKSPATTAMVKFYSPSELRDFEPPANANLVGDFHLQPGATSILGGPPGCGKSRATLTLAAALGRGEGSWFGLDIHAKARVLILQNENGMTRLHKDMLAMPQFEGLDDMIKISEPPDLGLSLANAAFRAEMRSIMQDFAPELVVVDPWNACVRDEMAREYQEGLSHLREITTSGPAKTAVLILHHIRKKREGDRQRGRSLSDLLAGSYQLGSTARAQMFLLPASDDVEDRRVVFCTAKKNDGDAGLGSPSCWRHVPSGFELVEDFDFEQFNTGGNKPEPKVREEHIRTIFAEGPTTQAAAAKALMELCGVGRSTAYEALKTDGGRFAAMIRWQGTLLALRENP
jgi:hypothetical protein